MALPTLCLREDTLAIAVRTGGLEEVRIVRLPDGDYHLNVKVKSTPQSYYLATQRNQEEPRRFKKIDPIVSIAQKLFGQSCCTFTIVEHDKFEN